jgi:hypothetical protein
MFGLFDSKSSSSSTTNYNDNSTTVNAETGGTAYNDALVANGHGNVVGAGGSYVESLDADVVARALSSIDASSILQSELAMNSVNRAASTTDAVVSGANAMVENNAKLAGQSMDTALAFAQQAAASLTPAGTQRIYAIAGMIAAVAIALAFFSRRKKR